MTNRLYSLPCPIIGLSGGIATGKSTVSVILTSKGFPIIDADKLVKEIYKTQEAQEFVRTFFPMCWNSGIDFKALRQEVFNNPIAKQLVEKFIYKHLPKFFLEEYQKLNSPDFVIYDAPLLFEKNLNLQVDYSVLVYAPRSVQKERLMVRDNSNSELAESILSQQMDIESKRKLADYVIDNSMDLNYLNDQVDLFITKLKTKGILK